MSETLTLEQFIERCLLYNKENGIDPTTFKVCPVHYFAQKTSKPCYKTISGIKECPLCRQPMCPECGRHNVYQISRITGYMSTVQGWAASKQQELKDRKRYTVKGIQ